MNHTQDKVVIMVLATGTDRDRLSERGEGLVETNALMEGILIYKVIKGQNIGWHLDCRTVKQVI